MVPVSDPITRRLSEADALLREHVRHPASLAPDRDEATPLLQLGQRLFTDLAEGPATALADGLRRIVAAQVHHFPETIFWDFDYMAAAMASQAVDTEETTLLADDIVSLQRQYGCQSVICFRYVHDFTYGFDWAKWTRRDPQQRAHIGPFDRAFVDHLMTRGDELEELIAHDDVKYPKLADGTPRNPFGFSREPEDERRLFLEMAARDLLPVRTWDPDATPVWDRPFAELRAEVAREIGTPTR